MKKVNTGATRRCAIVHVCSVVSIACCVGAAGGQSFQLNVIDAGGIPGGTLGKPITWTPSTLAYNPGIGSNFPPSPNAIFGSENLEFDSYIAIDPIGPSTSSSTSSSVEGYQSLGPTNLLNPTGSPTTPFLAGKLTGLWFNTSSNGSWVTAGPENRIFIAQISLAPGSSGPTTEGLMVNIRDGRPGQDPNGVLGALRFGIDNASNNSGNWAQSYHLKAFGRPITSASPAFIGGTCWDIFVVVAPSPCSAGLLGVGGLIGVAQRKRNPKRSA